MTDCPQCRNADGENNGPCPCPCHRKEKSESGGTIGYDSLTDSYYCEHCKRQYDDMLHAKVCEHGRGGTNG